MTALQLGFRVCDRRYPFLWSGAGQGSGRWNRTGDQPVHYLASTPTVAWAEWIRHQEITDPGDLAGVAAALWAVLIPQEWGTKDLDSVALHLDQVLDTSPSAQDARLALVGHLKKQGAQGLLAPTAALHDSDRVLPAVRVLTDGHKSESHCSGIGLRSLGGQGAVRAWGSQTKPIPRGIPCPAAC